MSKTRFSIPNGVKNFIQREKFIIFVLILATSLRLFQLGGIPDGLNRDEASLGYTAYSLLQSGTDEWGATWPINFKSFGDWKLGGYIYTLIPFISVLGLHDWVIRLPSAVSGISIILLSTILVRKLIPKESSFAKSATYLIPLFLTFSPWSLHVSRIAYEAHLGLLFFAIGFILFLTAVHKNFIWFISATFFFCASMLTYHAFQVVFPVFCLVLIVFYPKLLQKLWKDEKPILFASIVTGLIFGSLLLLSNTGSANSVKFSGLSIFSREAYADQIFTERTRFSSLYAEVAKLHSNSLQKVSTQFTKQLLSILSPSYLVLNGGGHPTHTFPGFGILHTFELTTLVVAFYTIWKQRQRWQLFTFAWLLTTVLPAAITFESTHPIRMIGALLPLTILSSFGLHTMLGHIGKIRSRAKLLGFGILFFIISYSYFQVVTSYFFQFSETNHANWPWYMKQIVDEVGPIQSEYDMVILQGESSSPYVYFLLYGKVNPNSLSEDIEYYSQDDEGFQHVKRYKNIYFQTAEWKQLEGHVDSILYVLRPDEIPGDKLERREYRILKEIQHPESDTKYLLLHYDRFG